MDKLHKVEITDNAGACRMEMVYDNREMICHMNMFLELLNLYNRVVPHARIYFQNMMAHGFNTILNIGCSDDPARLNKNFGAINLDLCPEVEKTYAGQYTKFIQSGVYKMPFEDKSFECSVLGDLIEHLAKPELALAEVIRVTSKRIVATIPSREFDEKIARPEDNKTAEERMRQLLKERSGLDTAGLTFSQVKELARSKMPLDQFMDHVQEFDTESIKKLFPDSNILFITSPYWIGFLIYADL